MTPPKKLFHVVLSTDSLSFPRPWNQKKAEEHPEQFFRYDMTYPYLLRIKLQQKMRGNNVVISNMGRRAVTIANLKHISRDLISWMQSDVVVIHHGIVDCWIRNPATGETRTSAEDFESILIEFFDLRREFAPDLPVIIIKVAHTNPRMLEKVPKQNEVIVDFNSVIEGVVSGELRVKCIEPAGHANPLSLVHEDGHHLSRVGHQYISERLFDEIIEFSTEIDALNVRNDSKNKISIIRLVKNKIRRIVWGLYSRLKKYRS